MWPSGSHSRHAPAPASSDVAVPSRTNREAFRGRLQRQFLRKDVDNTPFLLIALRMDRAEGVEGRPFDFDFITDLISESLSAADDMFIDVRSERLVVLLPGRQSDGAQPFFAHLKQRLQQEAPQQADELMRSVSAIAVPGGEPFRTAEEFLTYVLDTND